MRRDREGQPHIHAAGIVLDRRVDERLDLGEGDDLVELARDLARPCRGSRRSGRCSRGRSAPGGSRCRPRAGIATRPRMRRQAAVGSVIRDRIFSSVLLPAPLRPMMPTFSPRGLRNSRSATTRFRVPAPFPCRGQERPRCAELERTKGQALPPVLTGSACRDCRQR